MWPHPRQVTRPPPANSLHQVVAIDDERRAAVTRAACEREVAFARRFTDAPGLCHLLDFFAEGDGALVLVVSGRGGWAPLTSACQ